MFSLHQWIKIVNRQLICQQIAFILQKYKHRAGHGPRAELQNATFASDAGDNLFTMLPLLVMQ